jgi:signal transduction histidine kinase
VNGRLALASRRVDAIAIVRDAVELVRPRAQLREQTLAVSLPATPIVVNADAVRLQQVFMNVLSNPVSYTPPKGEIHVTAKKDTAFVAIQVRDTGHGIAAQDLSRIFGLFARAGDHHEGGFGIGLAVARSLVELHAGTIDVQSGGRGHGSEFRIALPLAVSSNVETV